LKVEVIEPFVFPSQVQQMSYADEPNTFVVEGCSR
jgi:hypothetical protein